MRAIKFRGWNKNTKKMIDLYKMTPFAVIPSMCNDGLFIPFHESVELMQFTGLHDKNGKEIYEGDIVTAREQSNKTTFTGYVHFLNAQYWVNYIGYESYYVPLMQLHNAVYEPIEVIGNIYENPELLESET